MSFLINNNSMNKMSDVMNSIADKLKLIKVSHKDVIIRFHNDGDGISGALSFSKYIRRARYIQQTSSIYSVRNAMFDLNELTGSRNPIVIFIDFGSGQESQEGLSLLKAGGVELIIIDHHPFFEEIVNYCSIYLNPWSYKSIKNPSWYSAGYLASEIIGLLGIDCSKYGKISICSDKSGLRKCEKEYSDFGLVLNYVAAYSTYRSSLSFYSSILENKELFTSMFIQANEKVEQLIFIAKRSMKKKKVGNFFIYYFNMGKTYKKYEFPGLGKSATQIFEKLIEGENTPSLLICYEPKTIVFRITNNAFELGADASRIINHLKRVASDMIISGGGHLRAAAIRINGDNISSLFLEIEDYLLNIKN